MTEWSHSFVVQKDVEHQEESYDHSQKFDTMLVIASMLEGQISLQSSIDEMAFAQLP